MTATPSDPPRPLTRTRTTTTAERRRLLARHVDRLARAVAARERADVRWTRLGYAAAALTLLVALTVRGSAPGWAVAAVVVAGAGVVVAAAVAQRRVAQSLARLRGWQAIKREHIARIDLDWGALPPAPPVPSAERAPLESDLNLVGSRSLLHLIDTASTGPGSARLRAWLAAGSAESATIRRRQHLVAELAPRHLLRDRLTLHARLVSADNRHWTADELLRWLADSSAAPSLRRWLHVLSGLALLNWLLLALNLVGAAPALWQATFLVYVLVSGMRAQAIGRELRDAYHLRDALEQLLGVWARLERQRPARAPHLRDLCRPFLTADDRPSRALRRVVRVVNATGVMQTPVIGLLVNAVLPWSAYFAYRLQGEKKELAARLPTWLDVWFELEALASLANAAYLTPEAVFPEIGVDDGPLLAAEQLGHPLLPSARRVCNDVTIGRTDHILLITGSNMAGKSTFLRTIGVNLALAFAGGTVVARWLRVAPLRLYSAIQVSDSVTDGISYFYAEVRRLKGLLDALETVDPRPLLFLVDEIFRGTNNRERLIGSRSFIRALAARGGTGLISTHDLELVHLADEVGGLHNFHFREEVVDGRMVFDYRLRPGPCPTTNALRIMRLAGLPVDDSAESPPTSP